MDLEQLGKIQPVEAPPFLFTRIQQKIELAESEKLPVKTAWALNLSFVLLLVINSVVLANYEVKSNTTEDETENVYQTSDNSLYQ